MNRSHRFKRVINGKQFFKVQDDQSWGRGLGSVYESVAATPMTPGSEAKMHFFHKRTCALIPMRKLN